MSDALHDDTEAEGRKIAIELLREARAYEDVHGYDSGASIRANERKRGQPQDNFVAKFLALIDGKPRAAAGLASVLSDVLLVDGTTDLVVYERADRQLRRRERRAARDHQQESRGESPGQSPNCESKAGTAPPGEHRND